jgi:hypothetical protein
MSANGGQEWSELTIPACGFRGTISRPTPKGKNEQEEVKMQPFCPCEENCLTHTGKTCQKAISPAEVAHRYKDNGGMLIYRDCHIQTHRDNS